MKLKPRPQYLSKLVAAQDNSLIKVITGMRRCGKSSLLTLFRQHLLQQGIAEDHIIMMNLESFQYSSFTFEDLHNAIADRMQQDDHYYLLLDEVTTGLDLSVQAAVLDLIQQIRRDFNVSMLVVSHDLGVIRMLADRTLVMLDGRVIESGLTDQILEDPQHAYTQQLVYSLL